MHSFSVFKFKLHPPSRTASVKKKLKKKLFWRKKKSLPSASEPRLHPSCPLLLRGVAVATHEETNGAL